MEAGQAAPPSKSEQQKQEEQKKQLESPASDPRLQTLQSDIAKTSGVKSVSEPVLDKKGDTAIMTAVATTAPSSDKTEDLVDNLRDDVIPKAIKGTDLEVTLGGQTAGYIDLAERIGDKLPSMILIVVGLSFIVLLVAFRSVLVPLKAAVCNLLSVGAAYGVVTFVFQEGHGATLLGLDGAVPIVSFAPLLMFAILFGLSMDYEVFLMTQVQEHYKEDGDAHQGGGRRAGHHREGDHLRGADHGVCIHELHPQRRPDGEGVRGRIGGRDSDRRDASALSARSRGHGGAGQGGVVAAPLA